MILLWDFPNYIWFPGIEWSLWNENSFNNWMNIMEWEFLQ